MKNENYSKYYFAYGSNLNLEQMKYHCPNHKVVGTSILKNYRLQFNGRVGGHSYLNIEEYSNSYVPIGIYQITVHDELRLDKYEGYPTLYLKKTITIPYQDTYLTGLIYVMRSNYSEFPPRYTYYTICYKGYKDFNFDPSILEETLSRSQKTLSKSLKYFPKKDC